MAPQAQDLEQLARWLVAYYRVVDGEKEKNADKIALAMIQQQAALDGKLKAKYGGKGLRYAATLAGDYKRPAPPTTESMAPPVFKKMIGGKRFVGGPRLPEPLPPSRPAQAVTAPPYRPSSVMPPYRPAAAGSSAKGTTGLKAADRYVLSEAQKAFLKRCKDMGTAVEFEQRNPKNLGSASYDRYELYKHAKTLGEVTKLGGKSADIPYDYARGYIWVPSGGEHAHFVSCAEETGASPPTKRPKMQAEEEGRSREPLLHRPKGFLPRKLQPTPLAPGTDDDHGDEGEGQHGGALSIPKQKKLKKRSPTAGSEAVTAAAAATLDPFGLTAADKSLALQRADSKDDLGECGDEDEDGTESALPGPKHLANALRLHQAGNTEQALEEVNYALALAPQGCEGMAPSKAEGVPMWPARAKRLRALLRMRSSGPQPAPRSALKRGAKAAAGAALVSNNLAARKVIISADLPQLTENAGRRDLAKESREESSGRRAPRGVGTLVDDRLRDLMAVLYAFASEEEVAGGEEDLEEEETDFLLSLDGKHDEQESVAVTYAFKDEETHVFHLHRGGLHPHHARPSADPPAVLPEPVEDARKRRAKRQLRGRAAAASAASAMVALIESQAAAAAADGTAEAAGAERANKYGKNGCTPLTLAARFGRRRSGGGDAANSAVGLVGRLLGLGGCPSRAMEGAIFLYAKQEDSDWVTALLDSLQQHTQSVRLADVVSIARTAGDTALLVAVTQRDPVMVQKLLALGARVDDPKQKRHHDGAPCYKVAQEKAAEGGSEKSAQVLALLDEHRNTAHAQEATGD